MKLFLIILTLAGTVSAQLTKEIYVDQVTLDDAGRCFVRETTVIKDSGKEIVREYMRRSLTPDDSLNVLDNETRGKCQAGRTNKALQKYDQIKKENENAIRR